MLKENANSEEKDQLKMLWNESECGGVCGEGREIKLKRSRNKKIGGPGLVRGLPLFFVRSQLNHFLWV
jgi:hypothetical protein